MEGEEVRMVPMDEATRAILEALPRTRGDAAADAMGADALIDFDRRLHVRYLGALDFEIWLTSQAGDTEPVRMSGALLKQLLDDRHTIARDPLKFARDGRDVVIYIAGEEQGRISAETLRDLVARAIRLRH